MLISEILDKAARKIERDGLWKEADGASKHGETCAAFAISGAVVDPCLAYLREEGRRFFTSYLGLPLPGDHSCAVADGIFAWNDAPERTQSEVVSKLREAAAKARAEGK